MPAAWLNISLRPPGGWFGSLCTIMLVPTVTFCSSQTKPYQFIIRVCVRMSVCVCVCLTLGMAPFQSMGH